MKPSLSRRRFLTGTLAAGAVAGVGDFGFLGSLPPVSAEEARSVRDFVQLQADIEPLVRLIEDTDRNRVFEEIGQRIRKGTSYGELLAAVMLAGVRGIQPRPVGFKFHAVLAVNSAHLAALQAEDRDRWLPLFWSIDNYKSSQARNKVEGDWHMTPVNEAKVPASHQARERFIEAMQNWDEDGADAAVAGLARTAGATEVMEIFWPIAARDFRSIGHKAIFAANGSRTLQTIGWRHAEPVLRSLAYALLYHEGENPAKRSDEADIPGRENQERVKKIRKGWQQGKITPEAATDLMATLRTGTPAESCEKVVALLNAQVDPASVWDGLFLGAGELLMRQPGIVGLHCLTTANALHYAYQTSGNDETRRFVTLQLAAFLPMFQKAMKGRGKVSDARLDTLEMAEPGKDGNAVSGILQAVSKDRMEAARQTLGYLNEGKGASAEALMKEARRLIFVKGRDSHDYKLSSAVLEDYYHLTPPSRARFLATSMFSLRGAGERDNGLTDRTRAALAKA